MTSRARARRATLALAIALLLAEPALAAAKPAPKPRPTPVPTDGALVKPGKGSPTPAALPIQDVTVEVQPLERAPGMPAQAPAGSHVEQPPAFTPFRALPLGGTSSEALRGFAAPRKKKPSPTPSPRPAAP